MKVGRTLNRDYGESVVLTYLPFKLVGSSTALRRREREWKARPGPLPAIHFRQSQGFLSVSLPPSERLDSWQPTASLFLLVQSLYGGIRPQLEYTNLLPRSPVIAGIGRKATKRLTSLQNKLLVGDQKKTRTRGFQELQGSICYGSPNSYPLAKG